MECNAVVQEGLWHSNARFTASMSRIMEEYSHPFKDDILVSTDTLTCDTPDRPKQWERSLHEPASGLTDRSSQPSGSSPKMQASYWFRVWGHTDKPNDLSQPGRFEWAKTGAGDNKRGCLSEATCVSLSNVSSIGTPPDNR
uniref:Uncharacterized protein n=1 Tax=Geospiza parvula TaxID=87175 RepID=A0A8U8BDZ3_GEOPR